MSWWEKARREPFVVHCPRCGGTEVRLPGETCSTCRIVRYVGGPRHREILEAGVIPLLWMLSGGTIVLVAEVSTTGANFYEG